MSKRKALALLVLALGEELEQEEKRQKRQTVKRKRPSYWIQKLFLDRDSCGFYAKLSNMEPCNFKAKMRMNKVDFDFILGKVRPFIKKHDTRMRPAIGPAERLAVTIRYLATGASMQVMSDVFRMSHTTVSRIVHETCPIIYNVLKDEFLKIPKTTAEWQHVANIFKTRWNFPNCIGALDGKHICIQAPANSGSEFYNYKNTNSIVLMALVDGEYKFNYVDVGAYGRDSDGGVFLRCSLSKALKDNSLNIPPPQPLLDGSPPVPHVILTDDAFPLKTYLMKPFPFRQQVMAQRVYNYRLSRARRVVENAFGIAAARFRILRRPIDVAPDRAVQIVLAICALHNFLITRNNLGINEVDREINGELGGGSWREILQEQSNFTNLTPKSFGRSSQRATEVREHFKDYFTTSQGEVPWQYDTVLRGTTI